MTVAVIGTGRVGTTLGQAFARAGIETLFGARHPDSGLAGTVTVEQALDAADIVVLTIPGPAVEDFLRTHGERLAGRLIVDAANNVGAPTAHSAEAAAKHAPGARYARAFNTLGVENFANPVFDGTPADLFFSCGRGDQAAVAELINAVGLRPMYLGENQYDALDGLLRLWFTLAVSQGHGRHLAFRTLTREGPA